MGFLNTVVLILMALCCAAVPAVLVFERRATDRGQS